MHENSEVKAGQILAYLEPDIFNNAVTLTKAQVAQVQARMEKQEAILQDISSRLDRRLSAQNSAAYSIEAIDKLKYEKKVAETDLKILKGDLELTQNDLARAEIDLERSIITSPVDGIILERFIEPGQTVNAALNTPKLFTVASDLSKIEIIADIDEIDINKLGQGQEVTFTAEGNIEDQMTATLKHIRQTPNTELNYVAYPVVFSADTAGKRLLPGMTANITIDLQKPVVGVTRIPTDATRYRHAEFKPTLPEKIKAQIPRSQWEGAARGYDIGTLFRLGKIRVFTVNSKGEIEPKLIKVGAANYEYTTVLEGDIKEGDKLLLSQKVQDE